MVSFKSKIARIVLSYFLLNQKTELYVNEMANKFKVDRGNLTRKLAEWEKEGVLEKIKRGNLSIYKINEGYPFLPEIKKIAQKTFGLEDLLKNSLKNIRGLKMAVIFGSYAKDKMNTESDVDLLLVGSHNSLEAQREIVKLQKRFDREINVVDMAEVEYKKRSQEDFLKNIFKNKYIKII